MSKWITRKSVPILDEHEIRDEDGKPTIRVDASRLQAIADKNNARVAKTGDLTPIVIGHTTDDGPEQEQPEIVGYACNFRVKPLFRTGKQAIHADFKFFADKADKVRQFPRRSVELWLSDWKIDPISLLGATTPERDLGLLQLSSQGRKFIRRYSQDSQMPFSPESTGQQPQAPPVPSSGMSGGNDSLVAELLAALEQTDVFQWVKQQMAQEQAMDALPLGPDAGMDPLGGMGMEGMPPLPPEMPDEGFDDEEEYDDEDYDEEDEEEEDDDEEEKPVKRSAVASAPSASNTFLPRGPARMSARTQNQVPSIDPAKLAALKQFLAQRIAQRGQPQRYQKPVRGRRQPQGEDRIQLMARAQLAERQRYSRAFHAMADELEDLKLRYSRAEREKDLIQLEAEGVLFDRVKELDTVMALDDEQYARHVNSMRDNYSRAPMGRLRYSAEDTRLPKAKDEGTSREDRDKIVDYAMSHGMTFGEAKNKLFGD